MGTFYYSYYTTNEQCVPENQTHEKKLGGKKGFCGQQASQPQPYPWLRPLLKASQPCLFFFLSLSLLVFLIDYVSKFLCCCMCFSRGLFAYICDVINGFMRI